jgi:hypothetical protein
MFFFEKKNQKTFTRLHPRQTPARVQTDEVFFVSFFFRKKKALPSIPSLL